MRHRPSPEIEAEISIALDATVAFYDNAVIRPGGKKRIGLEMFEVTMSTKVASECGGVACSTPT